MIDIKNLQTFSFINEEYKKDWIEFVPHTNNKVRYCEGTCGSEKGYDKWAVYDGATNFLAHISKIDRSVEYNGEADEYKKSFVKYALKKLNELEKK